VRILCVCTGNTCRSPMLMALLARALERRGLVATVESAGTAAGMGDPASHGAITAMATRGIDLAGHRSRPLERLPLAAYDRIYAMTSRHAAVVRQLGIPAARLAVVAADAGGVPDPFGGDETVYEACARVLEAEAARIAGELAGVPRTG
jgi:protein-tyrosine phosphatase